MNATVDMDRDPALRESLLQGLLAGRTVEQVAAELGMTVTGLTERVDLKSLRATARGLLELNRVTAQIQVQQRHVQAMDLLMMVADRCGTSETARRACSAVLRGPRAPGRRGPAAEGVAKGRALIEKALAAGPRPAKQVIEWARGQGVSLTTLKRAKRVAGIVTVREGFRECARFVWRLPKVRPPEGRKVWV